MQIACEVRGNYKFFTKCHENCEITAVLTYFCVCIVFRPRILSENRCYYAYGKLMKSRALNRSSKLQIYKSLIRPVVTYECEAWTLTNQD